MIAAGKRGEARRDSERRARGQGAEPAAAQDVGAPGRQHRNQAVGQVQLAAQLDGGGLLDEQRIGAGIQDETVRPLGPDQSPEAVGGLEQEEPRAVPVKLECRRKAADPPADDGEWDRVHQWRPKP